MASNADIPSSRNNNAPKKLLTIGAALALALVGGVAFAKTRAIEPAGNKVITLSHDVKMASDLQQPADYKPGLNRVTFQSEGVKMVGNLH